MKPHARFRRDRDRVSVSCAAAGERAQQRLIIPGRWWCGRARGFEVLDSAQQGLSRPVQLLLELGLRHVGQRRRGGRRGRARRRSMRARALKHGPADPRRVSERASLGHVRAGRARVSRVEREADLSETISSRADDARRLARRPQASACSRSASIDLPSKP